MNINAAKSFFLWSAVLNVAVLVVAFLVCVVFGDFDYRMSSKWFSISRETFDIVIFSFVALYKLFIWTFNIVPYIALVIIGKKQK